MLTYQPIFDIISIVCVPVAHPDRALDSDSKGSRFESYQAHHFFHSYFLTQSNIQCHHKNKPYGKHNNTDI